MWGGSAGEGRAHQQHRDVVDIGAGRSCDDQPAAGFQGVISVVVRQRFVDGNAQSGQSVRRGAVSDAAGRVRGTVGAVRADGGHHRFQSCQPFRCCQRQFLIPSAQAVARQVDYRLAA